MFNVCPGCGNYSDEKEIIDDLAVCQLCSYEHKIVLLPLYVVTGASGSGKTTVALNLVSTTKDFVILDQDVLWNDAFNSPDDNYRQFRNTWLRLIKNINQAGKPVVLFGSSTPDQFESCPERRYIGDIHYLTLVCDPDELKRRLIERPAWRQSGSEENLKSMLEFNQWLIDNSSETKPEMNVVDTTNKTANETVDEIRNWLV